jgi:hypothetical protein
MEKVVESMISRGVTLQNIMCKRLNAGFQPSLRRCEKIDEGSGIDRQRHVGG